MIIQKQEDIFNGLDFSNIYIVTDFDGTLTVNSSDSSWASILKNPNFIRGNFDTGFIDKVMLKK